MKAQHIFVGILLFFAAIGLTSFFMSRLNLWQAHNPENLREKIWNREEVTFDDIHPIVPVINERLQYGSTLLHTALRRGHGPAAVLLLENGANPYLYESEDKKYYSGIGIIANGRYGMGRPLGYTRIMTLNEEGYLEYQKDFSQMMVDVLEAYVGAGGDVNSMIFSGTREKESLQGDKYKERIYDPVVSFLANYEMQDPFIVLLNAGANPWLKNSEGYIVTITSLARNRAALDTIHVMIDKGYFDDRSQEEIQTFLYALDGYSPRGDQYSLDIQAVAKRILKRKQDYDESDDVTISKYDGDKILRGPARIFKNHYGDAGVGIIPWAEIKSDAVK